MSSSDITLDDFDWDEENLLDGEEEMSDREFMAEFFGEIFSGDQDNEIDETTTTVVSSANESRDDEVIEEIFNPNVPLTHSFWIDDKLSAKIYQDSDDDNRILTPEDVDKADAVLSNLEHELFGLPAVEERKHILRVVRKTRSIIQRYRDNYAKLDDISNDVKNSGFVSSETYDILVGLGAGMESRLPKRIYYTDKPSSVNLNATIEAVDAGKVVVTAGVIAAVMALAWKVIDWVATKFNLRISKGSKVTEKKAEVVEDAYDKNKKLEASGNPFRKLEDMVENEVTNKLKETHNPSDAIRPDDVRVAAAEISIAKMNPDTKKFLYGLVIKGGEDMKTNAHNFKKAIDDGMIPTIHMCINVARNILDGRDSGGGAVEKKIEVLTNKYKEQMVIFDQMKKATIGDDVIIKDLVDKEEEVIAKIKGFFNGLGKSGLVGDRQLKKIKEDIKVVIDKSKNFQSRTEDNSDKAMLEQAITNANYTSQQLVTYTKFWGGIVSAINDGVNIIANMEKSVSHFLKDSKDIKDNMDRATKEIDEKYGGGTTHEEVVERTDSERRE